MVKRVGSRVVTAAALGAALAFGVASPASAATSVTFPNDRFAGYEVASAGGFQSASTVVRVPTVDCTGIQASDGIALTISTTSTVDNSAAAVLATCSSEVEVAEVVAFTAQGGAQGALVTPGDRVRLSLKRTGDRVTAAVTANGTRLVSKGRDANQSVFVGVARGFTPPAPVLASSLFQPIVDGAAITSYPTARYTMVDTDSGDVLYTATKPVYSGGGFKVVSHATA